MEFWGKGFPRDALLPSGPEAENFVSYTLLTLLCSVDFPQTQIRVKTNDWK